ncbi:MAG: GTPase HflX [Clostridiales bacterium]|nr:GTPase HflX [Clostridiales bacterium]
MQKITEKVYIIQPILTPNYKTLHEEAVSLIDSADASYCGTSYQTIKEINPATFIGSGKLAEIKQRLEGLDNITILFNGELSPSQTLNISAALDGRKVIDRTTLILDIFAKNAISSEGKIQVELAQLKYIYPRLKGKGASLSRLGGGIGSRGPGETQLETDRRHIRFRIKYLEGKLKETETRRALQTERRAKDKVCVIALVGYTNTGKSTLLNLVTGSAVLSKDALFATLDPTARKFTIDGVEFLMVDTVGFLQALPTSIIEAFKSTLESALNCDLALFVADGTNDYDMQFKTTLDTLTELGFNKPYLKVINKCENINDFSVFGKDCICISAKENLGIDKLKREIIKTFNDRFVVCQLFIPYEKLSNYSAIAKYAYEKTRDYCDEGLKINATIHNSHLQLFKDYII